MKIKSLLTEYFQIIAGNLTRIILGKNTYAIIAETKSFRFAIDPSDYEIGRKLRTIGTYGDDEINRLKKHITLQSRVLVVGAHIGTLALPISKLCNEVVAIEANPRTFKLLLDNIALNSIKNCHAINIAASDKTESLEILLNTANSGGSKRVPKKSDRIYYYDKPKKIEFPAFELDKYLKEINFDAVIMDIEGSEFYALKGMQEILNKCKALSIEFLPHHLKNVSGVSPEDLLSLITPHFSKLTIPSKNIKVSRSDFLNYLKKMFDSNEGDDAIFFEK